MSDVTQHYVKKNPGAEILTVQVAYPTPKKRIVGKVTRLTYGYHATGDTFNMIRDDYEAQPRLYRIISRQTPPESFQTQHLPGIGPKVADNLQKMGINSKRALYELGVEGLKKAGMFPKPAERLYSLLQDEFEGETDAE